MKIYCNNKSINIKVCDKFWSKLIGLMFKKDFNYGICLKSCNSIHTFFMKKSIDVVMTDKDYNILYIYKNFKPWKIILPKRKVFYTFEVPTNKLEFKLNEKLKIS